MARGNETKKGDTIIKSFRLFFSRHRNHARLAIFALLPGVGRRSDIHLNIISRNLTRRQILKNGRTILESFPRVIFVKLSLSLSYSSPIRSNERRKKGRSQITRMQTHLRFPPKTKSQNKTKGGKREGNHCPHLTLRSREIKDQTRKFVFVLTRAYITKDSQKMFRRVYRAGHLNMHNKIVVEIAPITRILHILQK